MYIVYSIVGMKSSYVYYGYKQADTIEECLEGFIKQSDRDDDNRGDRRLINENNGDLNVLTANIEEVYDDELDAWIKRNDLRVSDSHSITGPTQFPGHIAERAKKERPGTIEEWKQKLKIVGCKTARQAYALGMWSKENIKQLGQVCGRDMIIKDLDSLSPTNFKLKYDSFIL